MFLFLGCPPGQSEPRAGDDVPAEAFAEAERVLAHFGQHLTVVTDSPNPLRTVSAEARYGFREYQSRGDDVSVFIYTFATEREALAAFPEIQKKLLDGSRASFFQRGRVVFWVEAPLLPVVTNPTFDAIVGGLSRP